MTKFFDDGLVNDMILIDLQKAFGDILLKKPLHTLKEIKHYWIF